MTSPACNIVIMGVSYFDGMAGSTRVRNLFEPLVRKNLIKAANLIYQSDNKEPIGKEGDLNGLNFRVIDLRLGNIFSIFSFWSKGMSFLKRNKQPGYKNILYNYNYPDLKNIVFILYAKMKGYKIILDIIEDNRYEAHASFINKVRIKTSLFLFRFSKRFTSAYVAISEHLYNRAELISKGKVPVYLIPITVNLNYFKNTGYSPDKNNLKIFYGGSFAAKDGLAYLLDAYETISKEDKNIQLILTGLGNPADTDKLKQKIGMSENKNRIIFKGFLNTDDYYTALNSCDIFCMTRINSQFANAGFPFKLGEFLASGKGVIATKVGDVPKYLFNEVNALLINPDSASDIAGALSAFIKNPEKIRSLGSEARRTAETHFDSERISEKLLSIFNSV
ncbi:MAG TPA: glycosyltransferase, partial [Ferruginibacter sp.]|nr:glycosyltransferase [Ferruginibacter sp.]